MNTRIFTACLVSVSLALVLTWAVAAQGPEPPWPTKSPSGPPIPPDHGPYRAPDGTWYMPAAAAPSARPSTSVSPQTTGGPDDYGYTWDDSVALNWIDASGGTDTGINSSTDHVGPIDIGFSFKYYENTYTQLYISRFGFVAFNDSNIYNGQSEIPSPGKPNDVIAPYWTPAYNVNGYVRYLRGGNAPNRWFAVEWNRLDADWGNEYTFETILHEDGDIVFQYGTITYGDEGWWCQASGIEDSTGLDGLSTTDFCRQIEPNHAVHIYRPAPSARVRVYPLYQGRFTRPGETVTFQVPIRNTGELGDDTYDLSASSSWPFGLYAADGTTPLTDTDSDGAVDTGSVVQGGSVTVTVKVTTPGTAGVGDDNSAAVTVRSSLNTSKSKTPILQTAIPAPFAQVFSDNADGAMSLYLVQHGAQAVKKATSDRHYGYDTAVAEKPNGDGFAYFWSKYRRTGSVGVSEIEYTLVDRYGETVRGITKLTNHTRATVYTYDVAPAVAVAPDGHIGVLWYRYLWNDSTSQSNYNIFFAILDGAGNLVYGPVNLTNNNAWGKWDDLNVPRFYNPRIAATADNRFVLAWERVSQEAPSGSCTSRCWLWDIYYAVRDTNGGIVRDVAKFTNGVAGGIRYHSPTLTTLSNNRVLLAYSAGSIYYAVLDSAGNIVKAETSVEAGGWRPDAVQLSGGNIVVAWSEWSGSTWNIGFVVLDSAYNRIAGPTTLSNSAAVTGDDYVSVAADGAGHAILTWTDADGYYRRNLYYALVDGSGNVLTNPMIFRTSQATEPYISISYEGYGNTSYSWTPPSDVDGIAAFSASLFGGPPGGNAAVGVRYANHGATTATGVVLTTTLASGLTYVSDTSGVVPTVSGNDVVWSLPDMGFLGSQDFTLYVQVPSGAAYGTRYPVRLTLTSDGPEANAGDNTASAEIMAARQVFLPLVLKGY